MAVGSLGLLGAGAATTAATTLTLSNTSMAVIPAGTLLHITGTWDNANTNATPAITCSTVGGGTAIANHSPSIGSGATSTAGTGIWHQCFRVLTTADIAVDAVFATLTSDQSAVKRVATAHGFTDVTTTLRTTVTSGTSTAGTPTVTTSGTLSAGDLVIGSGAFEAFTFPTSDTDTLNGSWSPWVGHVTATGATAANVCCGAQSKIVTATGNQTFNPVGLLDSTACAYALVPATVPAITQASYRFYADGSETASTALAAQDTAPTVDLGSGDVNLQLRARLQSTSAVVASSTDDWRLQCEKNASGSWTDVRSSTLFSGVHDFFKSTASIAQFSAPGANADFGQTFMGNGQVITRASLYFQRLGVVAGPLKAEIYAHTGTFGTSGLPTGSALATSAPIESSTLSTAMSWVDFDFDGSFLLAAGTPYVVVFGRGNVGTDSSNCLQANQTTANISMAPGNQTLGALARTTDALYRVYSASPASLPYDSANLTGGGTTTNRLGAGTGTFVAGKVSESGAATDLGLSANNYTEVLYSLTLKAADLANADVLRFRVVRNGAVLTYGVTPTVTVAKAAAQIPRNIRMANPAIARSYTR